MRIHPYWKEKIKKCFGIKRPSQVFKSIGAYFAYGFVLGQMQQKMDDIDYKNKKVSMGVIHLPESRFEKAFREFKYMKEWYD